MFIEVMLYIIEYSVILLYFSSKLDDVPKPEVGTLKGAEPFRRGRVSRRHTGPGQGRIKDFSSGTRIRRILKNLDFGKTNSAPPPSEKTVWETGSD